MINPFLQSLSRRNKFLAACCSSFFRSSKFSALSRREAPSKSSQGFTLCFQLLFLFIILLLPEFFMEALHDGSSRIYISSWSVHRDSFLRNSSILHLAIRSAISFYRIFGGGIMSFLIIPLRCFVSHKLSRMRYFKSINLFFGVILSYISPKAFPKDCCHLWCL